MIKELSIALEIIGCSFLICFLLKSYSQKSVSGTMILFIAGIILLIIGFLIAP
jgi:hypothetical protein